MEETFRMLAKSVPPANHIHCLGSDFLADDMRNAR